MPDRYRIQLYWPPRTESVELLARKLHDTLVALGGIHPTMTGFAWDDGERDVPISSVEDCRRALDHGKVEWSFGATAKIAYEVTVYLTRAISPPLSLTLTCGVEPEDLHGVFAPNRLEMWIRRDAPDELASLPVLQAALGAVASRWEADFGYVGTATLPPPAEPLLSAGLPPVGWMTYLSKNRPPLPPSLPSPAVAYAVGSAGAVVVAHPKLYRDHLKEQRDAIAAVEQALARAGVLKHALPEPPPSP
jgi:hypothetical protein